MACADVATAEAKTTAINLSILSSYVNLHHEPRPMKRIWVDVLTFPGANPALRKAAAASSALILRNEPRSPVLGLAAANCLVDAERNLSANPLLPIHGAPTIGEPIDVAAAVRAGIGGLASP